MANYKEYVYQPIMYLNGEKTILCKPDLNEYFKFTINSGDDSSFILPLSGGYYRTDMQEYNLLVDWGDGVEEIISGTSSEQSHGYEHTYSSANTNYQITLRPNGDLDGWGGAFGFSYVEDNEYIGCDTEENHTKMISLDSPLTKSMVMKETTTDYILAYMFNECPNLTMGDIFNLPQDISGDIGDNFCRFLFRNCYNISMNDIFNLPQNITKVGELFCHVMFQNCTSLEMNDIFNLPPNITEVDYGFCYCMMEECPNLYMNEVFNIPQNISGDVGDCFCRHLFYHNTNMTMNSIFNLPQRITSTGIDSFLGMFDQCIYVKMNNIFQLPQNITTCSENFCYYMFNNCTSITTGVQRFFGNLVLNQEQLNQTNVFRMTFYNCSSITEECSADTIPQLSVSPSSNNNCFTGASTIARQNCPVNWGGLLS